MRIVFGIVFTTIVAVCGFANAAAPTTAPTRTAVQKYDAAVLFDLKQVPGEEQSDAA